MGGPLRSRLVTKSWRSLRTRIFGSSVALVAIMAVSGQQAYAATHVVKDHKYDTYEIADADSPRLTPSRGVVDDITSVRTTHGAKAVNVVIKVQKLRRSANIAEVELMTSATRHSRFDLLAIREDGVKSVELINESDPSQDIRCKYLRVRFDVADGAVKVHIPRSCIGNPRWVRTGAMVMGIGSDKVVLDVAGKTVLTNKWFQQAHLPLSTRVHVG